MILIICEKPAQARDIARHLKATAYKDGYLEGNGYQVTWCLGHLLELAPPEYYRPDIKPWRIEKLPVIPKQWKMLVSAKTKKQFNVIRQLLKNTHHVIIASDPDRAGEAIVREVLDYCHYHGKIKRLWLSSLDDTSIKKALSTLKSGDETVALYEAEKSRAASDYLIGLNLSMAASSLYGVNSVLSLGRVQTPTLRLVVDRDREIEQFTPHDYFVLTVLFNTSDGHCFWSTWQPREEKLDQCGYCIDSAYVNSVAAKVDGEPGIVTNCTTVLKKQTAPLCLSLSALQKKASAHFGYGAKHVLNTVQSLYEKHKAVTYPRTDNGYLPQDQFHEAQAVMNALVTIDHQLAPLIQLCDTTVQSAVWNDKKVTAHHAIIPTLNDNVDINQMSPEEKNLYDVIRRHYLAQFMSDYQYQATTIRLHCAGESFVTKEHTPIQLGWKQAFGTTHHNASSSSDDKPLPLLKKGNVLDNDETKVVTHQTKPPPYFTEGTLIEAMKTVGNGVEDESLKKILKASSGIGTEATRANIIEVLFKRGYLRRQGKKVQSTEKGRALLTIAPKQLKDPILTAQWEEKLDQIAQGKFTFDEFIALQCHALYAMLDELTSSQQQYQRSVLQLQSETHSGTVYLCPQCDSPLRRLHSKTKKYFWGCIRYPDCRFTTWEKNNRPHL